MGTIAMDQALYGESLAAQGEERYMRVVRRLPEQDWREFVDQHLQGNIFHTPEMFQVFAQTKDFSAALWAVLGTNGEVEALFAPVQVTLNRRFRSLTTRAISYGSVLCSSTPEGHRALSLLLNAYIHSTGTSCLFTELRNTSALNDEQPLLQETGFAYEDHLNYLIDLQGSPEEVFMRIGPRTRKNIKKGLNKGEVTIREVTEPQDIDVCYQLISMTYQTAKVPLADRSLFDAAFELLYPKGMVRFTLAYLAAQPIAVSVDLIYKDVIYGWYAGMDRAYGKYMPNDLLMWDVLQWGSKNGYSLYDFGGAGKPEESYGVRDFKAKFGGKLVCYGRNTYVHRPHILWLSKQGYRVVRHLSNGRF